MIAKLKLVAGKREGKLSPVVYRRQKLASKIDEQLEIAIAKKEGRPFCPKRIKTIRDDSGEQVAIEVNKRFREWFWSTAANKIYLSVRYGSKTLELAKGKNAIELASLDELIETLTVIRQAVIDGELDEAVKGASEKLRAGFKK